MIHLSITHGLNINATDIDKHTPIQLAIENHASQATDLLLNNAASGEVIAAADWLQAYSKPASDLVKLVEDASGRKQIAFLAADHFKREGLPPTDIEKRLL